MVAAAVFDAYGTLFDVHAAVRRHAALLGARADAVSQLWRARQLEYTWVRSLAGRYADFRRITADALDFALASHGIDDPPLRRSLLDAYMSLSPYPEVRATLADLRQAGLRTAILSNGTPDMLDRAVRSAGLDGLLDAVLSVDALRCYKPDPRVYALAVERLGVPAGEIAFLSANAWDAAGAASFGFRAYWINRTDQPREYAALGEVRILADLTALAALLG